MCVGAHTNIYIHTQTHTHAHWYGCTHTRAYTCICIYPTHSVTLWVKSYDVRRRDTIFYAVLFIWPPTRAAPIGRTFASRLRAPKVDPSRLASRTRLFLSSNSHTTSARFRCVTSPVPFHPVSSRTVMTSEWHLHPPARTRVNTCFNVTPNQACAEPKGSQPN